MTKGEIAHSVQFLLLSLFFKKLSAAEASESVYMREKVKTAYSTDAIKHERKKLPIKVLY